jgi:hypothetical protein
MIVNLGKIQINKRKTVIESYNYVLVINNRLLTKFSYPAKSQYSPWLIRRVHKTRYRSQY